MDPQSIDYVISVCSAKDIDAWSVSNHFVIRNIASRNYFLIVPSSEIELFKSVTDASFEIISEEELIDEFGIEFRNRIPNEDLGRYGWYLQQFLKLASLVKYSTDKNRMLIWDADTIPLRKLVFFDDKNKVRYYTGSEHHVPYFQANQRILGFSKLKHESFIAQCFPVYGAWVQQMVTYLERNHENWLQWIISQIDFGLTSGFSEYEFLGDFMAKFHGNSVDFQQGKWTRSGHSVIGKPQVLTKKATRIMWGKIYDFAAFEENQLTDRTRLARYLDFLKNKAFQSWAMTFNKLQDSGNAQIESELRKFFLAPDEKVIVQIGANDGIQNDPLRLHLREPGNYRAFLVEPLPYYASLLRSLYADRPEIEIIECAAGEIDSTLTLHYVDPEVAQHMNGAGPENNWAHGQGSFEKSVVEYWIYKNSFRGQEYRDNIPLYLDSITSVAVKQVRTSELVPPHDNVLLVIDVQGFEFDVIRGIDFENAPKYVLFESDLGDSMEIESYLRANNYEFITGVHDKLFKLMV